MTLVVGVHGVGNALAGMTPAQAADQLSKVWTHHLGAVPGDLRVAYYAHHLAARGRQGAVIDDPARLDPEIQAMVLAWVAQLGAPQEVAQGRATAPVRQALSWVADRFGLDHDLVHRFVARFFGEVAAYLRHADRRAAARAAVADLIAAHRPHVVIAHSLGSVIAYEALWARPDLHIELLVTLGSPLAMPDVVFDRLDPAPNGGRGDRPPGVTRWVNLADPGDLIAIPRPLTRRFSYVDADDERSIHAFDFHRVARYLACPAPTPTSPPTCTPT